MAEGKKKEWKKPEVENFEEDELMKKMAVKAQTGAPHTDAHQDSHQDSGE